MLSLLKSLFVKSDNSKLIAQILSEVNNREELLGMKPPVIPTPDGIKVDASRILKYTDTQGYKTWAEEAWARVIQNLDKILDVRTTKDQRDYYCGAVNESLNLLRLSYLAKETIKQYDKEHEASSQLHKRG